MVQTICKNTFISVAIDAGDDDITDYSFATKRCARRSRSAEVSRTKLCDDELALTQQSLQRLNVVLSLGISSPAQSPKAETASTELDSRAFMLEGKEKSWQLEDSPSQKGTSIADLCALQEKLAKALATPSKTPQPKFKFGSSSSLSTMAPDDMSSLSRVSTEDQINDTVADEGSRARSDSMEEVEFKLQGLDEENDAEDVVEPVVHEGVPWTTDSQVAVAQGQMKGTRSVPRTRELTNFNGSKHESPTTVMIRNIPGRYSQNDILAELGDMGFTGSFDFVYLPMDKGSAANVGYVFVNFINTAWARKCMQAFEGYRFTRYQRTCAKKVAKVSVAHLQGLEENLQYYRKTAVNMSKDKRRRPMVMANIAKALE